MSSVPTPRRGAHAHEVTIELADPDELFNGRPAQVAQGTPVAEPGIERLRNELSAVSLRGRLTLVVALPKTKASPAVERGLKTAIARYCESGARRAENELKAIRRDGLQTLLFGAVVLAAFLGLSELVLNSGAPKGIRDFFGNGLFLVAAWVGMWYPLDTLVYSGRPHRLERTMLRAIGDAEIVVRPSDGGGAADYSSPT